MKYHEDDRAQRLQDVFKEMNCGQINVSYVNSTEHVVCWHSHKIQTDYWCVLKGQLKVGLGVADKTGKVSVHFEYLSDKNFRVLKITPGIYHGYKAMIRGTILMYYLTEKYDPSDEYRAKMGDFGEDWTTINK